MNNTDVYFLFLDDFRMPRDVTWVEIPPYPWTIVRSYDAFVEIIKKRGLPTFISFDHDLGQEHYADINDAAKTLKLMDHKINYDEFKEKTGYHCAQYLIEACLDHNYTLPEYTVHSMNPIGRDNIRNLLEGFKKSR